MEEYSVILIDAVPPTNEGREKLKSSLAVELGLSLDKLERVFGRLPVVLKEGLSSKEANNYQEILIALGASVRIDSKIATVEVQEKAPEKAPEESPGAEASSAMPESISGEELFFDEPETPTDPSAADKTPFDDLLVFEDDSLLTESEIGVGSITDKALSSESDLQVELKTEEISLEDPLENLTDSFLDDLSDPFGSQEDTPPDLTEESVKDPIHKENELSFDFDDLSISTGTETVATEYADTDTSSALDTETSSASDMEIQFDDSPPPPIESAETDTPETHLAEEPSVEDFDFSPKKEDEGVDSGFDFSLEPLERPEDILRFDEDSSDNNEIDLEQNADEPLPPEAPPSPVTGAISSEANSDTILEETERFGDDSSQPDLLDEDLLENPLDWDDDENGDEQSIDFDPAENHLSPNIDDEEMSIHDDELRYSEDIDSSTSNKKSPLLFIFLGAATFLLLASLFFGGEDEEELAETQVASPKQIEALLAKQKDILAKPKKDRSQKDSAQGPAKLMRWAGLTKTDSYEARLALESLAGRATKVNFELRSTQQVQLSDEEIVAGIRRPWLDRFYAEALEKPASAEPNLDKTNVDRTPADGTEGAVILHGTGRAYLVDQEKRTRVVARLEIEMPPIAEAQTSAKGNWRIYNLEAWPTGSLPEGGIKIDYISEGKYRLIAQGDFAVDLLSGS